MLCTWMSYVSSMSVVISSVVMSVSTLCLRMSVCVSCWFYCFADGGVVEVVLESGVDEKIGVLF